MLSCTVATRHICPVNLKATVPWVPQPHFMCPPAMCSVWWLLGPALPGVGGAGSCEGLMVNTQVSGCTEFMVTAAAVEISQWVGVAGPQEAHSQNQAEAGMGMWVVAADPCSPRVSYVLHLDSDRNQVDFALTCHIFITFVWRRKVLFAQRWCFGWQCNNFDSDLKPVSFLPFLMSSLALSLWQLW